MHIIVTALTRAMHLRVTPVGGTFVPQHLGRLVVGVALSLIVPLPVLVGTASRSAAAGACPPARIDSFRANNVVPGTYPPPTGPHPDRTYTPQRFRLNADNPCNGTGCPQDDPSCVPTFTYVTATGKRTVGSGASCRFTRETDPSYERQPSGLYSYWGTWNWTDKDAKADGSFYGPRLTNDCAGAYDVTVRIRNEKADGSVTSTSAPYRQSRSFVVRRPSRLTTNARPEPVRIGGTVTVRGRLTRTDWDRATNPQVAYAGQRVLLQRATPTGRYHTLKAVRTDRRGYLHTRVKALSGTRCYRWVFHTNATTQGRAATQDCVRAQ